MSKLQTNKYGDKFWRNDKGNFHREVGPAVEYVEGTKHWYRDGEIHREDGPAIELINGESEYWYGGKRYFGVKNNSEWERIIRLMVFR